MILHERSLRHWVSIFLISSKIKFSLPWDNIFPSNHNLLSFFLQKYTHLHPLLHGGSLHIFFASLTGILKFSAFNISKFNIQHWGLQHFFKMQSSSFTNLAIFYLHSATCQKIEFNTTYIFILQWRLEQTFIFVFQATIGIFKSIWKPARSPYMQELTHEYRVGSTIQECLLVWTAYRNSSREIKRVFTLSSYINRNYWHLF